MVNFIKLQSAKIAAQYAIARAAIAKARYCRDDLLSDYNARLALDELAIARSEIRCLRYAKNFVNAAA